MRIVIDMQGAQSTGSWNRGIGRYTMSLAQSLVRNRQEHEIYLALNGLFSDSIERIRASFEDILPQENIHVWYPLQGTSFIESANKQRRYTSEVLREAFFENLNPDFILISSLFEGLADDTVTSVKKFNQNKLTAVILYDLIPYIHRKPYLENPVVADWYMEKLGYLRQADLCLSISESSCQEGIEHLGFAPKHVVNISTDADAQFRKLQISNEIKNNLYSQYGLDDGFILYTGGIDHRKNIEGLICAYANMSSSLRSVHNLVIVCSVQDEVRRHLMEFANKQGVNQNELIFTGYIPEDDLINLYNLCTLFVFPSWHEGFGLPVLEAMRCGAPVIATNASSLPEVVGLDEALFEPHNDHALQQAMERALTDTAYRQRLIQHGQIQAQKFSWDKTAKRAIDAMVEHASETENNNKQYINDKKKRLAYVSPLPPERSGISDYSAELLPELAIHYEVEVVVQQDQVSDEWVEKNIPVRSVEWFMENHKQFDRVIYHFGNSHFHAHMFDLLRRIPGVVVLHDFFISGIRHHMSIHGVRQNDFSHSVYQSHGYSGLDNLSKASDIADIIWKYPCNLDVLQRSLGTIFHSENSIRLLDSWYPDVRNDDHAVVIPHLRNYQKTKNKLAVRKEMGFDEDDFIVCSFGILGPTKLNHRLLDAWLTLDWAQSRKCHLIFVGQNDSGQYGAKIQKTIKENDKNYSIKVTGWASQDGFRNYLAIADVGVQLRTLSRGETSGTVLDCMNYGLATIVNANGSMADLPNDGVLKLPDEFSDKNLADALDILRSDSEKRNTFSLRAKEIILEQHDPKNCAEKYFNAIEGFYQTNPPIVDKLIDNIAKNTEQAIDDFQLQQLALAISNTFHSKRLSKHLLVDISELVQLDSRTEIQRVVRSILREWLLHPPAGWRVEPVYAATDQPYRYARQFTCQFLGLPDTGLTDDVVEFSPGDIFFALDLQPQVQTAQADFYQFLRQQGVTVKFMVYDLLCIQQPEHFHPGVYQGFEAWLHVVGESDGAVCISEAVADDLRHWMQDKTWSRLRPFQISANHLGADLDNSIPTRGMPDNAASVLDALKSKNSFLMVGTLEPRKAHAQVLQTFEQLWHTNQEINLVIVGKQGWMVEELVEKLRHHPEQGQRLFWLEGISDEYLEKVYAASTCLIAASYGEGFGLPLIEAAQHKLPIIARDIPVFREVAGEHAFYFDNLEPDGLAQAVQKWLALYKGGNYPRSDKMPWLTWKESAAQLVSVLLESKNE